MVARALCHSFPRQHPELQEGRREKRAPLTPSLLSLRRKVIPRSCPTDFPYVSSARTESYIQLPQGNMKNQSGLPQGHILRGRAPAWCGECLPEENPDLGLCGPWLLCPSSGASSKLKPKWAVSAKKLRISSVGTYLSAIQFYPQTILIVVFLSFFEDFKFAS